MPGQAEKILVRYYRTDHSSRNGAIAVVFGSWPTRVLTHRGWTNERQIYSRVATPSEAADIVSATRYMSSRYKTVGLLLEDERRILDDVEYRKLVDVLTEAFKKEKLP